ncbi:PAS domain-containing protein [Polyangium aurulentum]|uniref:PAS domain-containing protein n=1 Tax=Polyangium aurulentum TaxID=2567896 RepID=UPI00146DD79E|nr:PAS domain-containing protein [Polyangium aurulentum]UQA57973.1 PAS domain-containing protein [Polyangium aurulentum]
MKDEVADELAALRARVAELEGALAEHRALPYAAFFERSLVLLCVASPDGRFLRLNPAWERTLGWTDAELRGRPFLDFVHPDDRDATIAASQAVAEGNAVIAFENRYQCKDGSYRYLRWHTAPTDEHGRHYAVAQDITLQRTAEQRARVFEDTILSSATGTLVLHLEQPGDPASLRLVIANDAASKLCGVDLQAELGRSIVEIFPNVLEAGLAALYAELASAGGTRDFGEVEYGDDRVTRGTFAIKAYALPNRRVCITFENVTERRRIEAALRQTIQQEAIIRAQAAALAELSTPLIPLTEEVVVMPLVGTVDSGRAQQVIDTLLTGIERSGARIVILDITGVALVDTQVADAFIRAARSAKLLGAKVMITGIRPEVAMTLIGLAVDLGGIMTHGSLQTGIAAALGWRRG